MVVRMLNKPLEPIVRKSGSGSTPRCRRVARDDNGGAKLSLDCFGS